MKDQSAVGAQLHLVASANVLQSMQNGRLTMNTLAVVIGATGGIGRALIHALTQSSRYDAVIGLSRSSTPALELMSEASIQACSSFVAVQGVPRLIIDATGVLQTDTLKPEKSWRELDSAQMAQAFAINAIGPALVMKHFLPLLPREGSAVFATLSARVGSIGDNRLGGWYSYRASKAALNQLLRTAAIELNRRAPNAICVALHPGTVDTGLSSSFAKIGLDVQTPELAAARLLDVIVKATPADSGKFFDYSGAEVPW